MLRLILQAIVILSIIIIYFGINTMGVVKIIDLCANEDPNTPSITYWVKLISISLGCILSAAPCLFLIRSI